VPNPSTEHEEDINPAYPPELPPVVRSWFHGFKDLPQIELTL